MGKKRYDADYDLGNHQRQNQADQQEQDNQQNATSYGDRDNTASQNDQGDRPQQPQNQPQQNDPRNRGDDKRPADDRDRNDQDRSQKDNQNKQRGNQRNDNQAKQEKDRKTGGNNPQAEAVKKRASPAGKGLGAAGTGAGGLGAGDLMNRGVKNLTGDKLKNLSDAKDNLTNPKMGLKNLAKKHGLPTQMPTANNIKDGIKNKVKDGVKNTLKEGVKPLDFERPPQTATARSLRETIEHDREQIKARINAAKKVAKTMQKATRFAILHYFLFGLLFFAVLAAAGGAISLITNNMVTNTDSDCSTKSTTDSGGGGTVSGDESTNMNTIYKTIMEGVPKATPAGVAGLLGNGMNESRLNPAAIQDGRPYNDATAKNGSVSAYAFGVWQMDNTRRVQLINYAAKANKKWNDLGAQIAYIFDPAGDGANVPILYRLITTGSDPATSAEDFRAQWERGGAGTTAIRQRYAKEAYAKMADKHYSYKSPLKSLSTGKAISFGSSGSGSSGSSSGGSDSNISNGNDAANDNSDNSACDKNSDDAETGAATELLGKALTLGKKAAKSHKYVYSMYGKRDGSDDSFDCSGFVTTMLKEAGYSKIPLGSTVSMLAATEGSSPEVGGSNLGSKALYRQVDLKTAKKGTIVIFGGKAGAGGAGHVVFLAENFHGDSTKVLECTDWATGEGDYSNKSNGPKIIAGQSAKNGPEYGGTYGNASSPGSPVAVLPLDSDK